MVEWAAMSDQEHSARIELRVAPAVGDLVGRVLGLAEGPDREGASAVHEVRVAIKRLRAAARLVEPLLGEEVFGQVDDAFRGAGRVLAGRRDADVLAATLRRVVMSVPEDERGVLLAIASELPSPTGAPPADWAQVTARIREGQAALEAAVAPTEGCVDVAPGLRTTYRKTRKLGKRALKSGVAEGAHRWRRWVKHLLYQVELLEAAVHRPVVGKKTQKRLTQLGKVLGRHHDLALLSAAAGQWPAPDSPVHAALLAAATALERKLLRKAKKLSKGALGDKTGEFMEKIARRMGDARGC